MDPNKNHGGVNLRKKCDIMSFYPGCGACCCKHRREQMSRLERDPSVAMVIAGRGQSHLLDTEGVWVWPPRRGPWDAAVVRTHAPMHSRRFTEELNAAATMTADVSAGGGVPQGAAS